MLISNKIYRIDYNIICHNNNSDIISHLFINSFYIEPMYRSRGYSRRILKDLQYKKYDNILIFLECWPTLLKYYKHLEFVEISRTYDGYIEMMRK